MHKKKAFNFFIVACLLFITLVIISCNFIYVNKANKTIFNVIKRGLSEFYESDDNEHKLVNDINYKVKKNALGVINIPGTKINEIIMQGDDNEYYLTHDNDGNYSLIGSIYMDYRNSIDDRKILIFGHNSKDLDNVPFKDLEKFTEKKFYEKNRYINLTLGDENNKWEIFSVKIISKSTNNHMKLNFSDEEWLNHIKWLKENSLYNTDVLVTKNDKIVILQTCYFKRENNNLIISAKKV